MTLLATTMLTLRVREVGRNRAILIPKKAPKYGIVITTPPTQLLHDRLEGCKSSRAPGTLNAGP